MNIKTGAPKFLESGPADAALTLILAHGAGGPMDSPHMEYFAGALATDGVRVLRFEFPYMAARRTGGSRRAPDPPVVLRATWLKAVAAAGGGDRVVIGGKSLGGRIATMIADEAGVRGCVCLGYPFHPPGKPQQLRTTHLESLRTPTLIVQGTRDPFGTREEVSGYELSPSIRIVWMEDGDHSFKPRRASGRTEEQNLAQAVAEVRAFLLGLPV